MLLSENLESMIVTFEFLADTPAKSASATYNFSKLSNVRFPPFLMNVQLMMKISESSAPIASPIELVNFTFLTVRLLDLTFRIDDFLPASSVAQFPSIVIDFEMEIDAAEPV